ncbi:MAG: hypothetical protein ABIN39_04035 [candidate division WOR-3 bacterium]
MRNKLKPVLTGFFFILSSLFLKADGSYIDSIINKNNFYNYEFFFIKSLKLFSGEVIGNINGKIVLTEDSTKLFLVDKNKSFIIGYNKKGVFEEKDGKKIYQKNISLLKDLEIMTTLNPMSKLKNTKYTLKENCFNFSPGNGKVDEVKIFFNKNFFYDSIFFIKGTDTIMSTFYRYDDKFFPVEIITYDRLKGIVENIKNYRIKTIDFFR